MGALKNFITKRALLPLARKALDLSPVDDRRGWWKVLETYAGAWQQNIDVNYGTVDAYWANFACLTLIAGDISKLPLNVMRYDESRKIWVKTQRRPVIRRPNHYQTTLEFVFAWVTSQLRNGNTYVLKSRAKDTGFVEKLFVLDPYRVQPLVTKDGGVYYRLETDDLAGLNGESSITVPASEIIHDRMYPLYHPLIGLPPIFACGMASMQGAAIVNTSAGFFTNRGLPAGVLTAPGHIPDDTAQRLKEYFDGNFTGPNAGKVAVLGDALKFESLGMKASDAQLIEQLKMTGEMIAACYHVPGYKIGVGPMPTVANVAALNQQYYDQCLQYIIEKMEARLDEGLELADEQCWFDTKVLLRMDPQMQSQVISEKVKGGVLAPNEARREDDLEPVDGGDQPFLQQQNYSLRDLARRSENEARARSEPVDGNVQSQAMNGGQVGSLQALMDAVASGKIPADSASAAIAVAFPTLTSAEISAIVDPLKAFTPQPSPAAPAPTPAPAPNAELEEAPPDDEVDESDIAEEEARFAEIHI